MSHAIKERSEVSESQTWNLTDLFPTPENWEREFQNVQTQIKEFEHCHGMLKKNADSLADCLDRMFDVAKRANRLSTYASLLHDQDARVVSGQELSDRSQKQSTALSAALAFVDPEILEIPTNALSQFLRSPRLLPYRHFIDNVTRKRAHILSPGEEEVIARTGDMDDTPHNVYETLSTINLPYPQVTLSNGEKATLTAANYTLLRASPNREDRIKVFTAFWSTYRQFQETMAGLLSGAVNGHLFQTRVRKYNSDLERSLDRSNVPTSIYGNMLTQIRDGRPLLWRYINLRKKLLGLSELGYHDLYASIVPSVSWSFDYEQAQQVTVQALKPLGAEYTSVLEKAFAERWTDVHPTKGKRSGAYMNGSAYDVHPYVLLNYNCNYESLSTLAHEFGHALHSHLSNQQQPFVSARYPTFIAEVASTVNENLLRLYLLKHESDPQKRLFLLGEYLDGFRTTVFRQALFAQYELQIHEAAQQGQSLTAESLNQRYLKLLQETYGESNGTIAIDPLYAIEWAYIPHFYYDFYMFQYTTSFVAATTIAAKIFEGDNTARERYLEMLKAGGSKYPVELLQLGGVDMTQSDPYREAFKAFEQALSEVERLVGDPKASPPARR